MDKCYFLFIYLNSEFYLFSNLPPFLQAPDIILELFWPCGIFNFPFYYNCFSCCYDCFGFILLNHFAIHFMEYISFSPVIHLLRYNWNIVESGVKHHNPVHLLRVMLVLELFWKEKVRLQNKLHSKWFCSCLPLMKYNINMGKVLTEIIH
jgi:hypothetical protein